MTTLSSSVQLHEPILGPGYSDGEASGSHFSDEGRFTTPQQGPYRKVLDRGCFFVLGMVTDFVYIVFILAAADMLKGSDLPTTASLLADIIPGTIFKLVFPWFMSEIPYPVRVMAQVLLSCGALLLAALADNVGWKLVGIVLGSLSCGIGEVTFLALTSKYDKGVIGWYSSGLGSSGPLGGALYIGLTLGANLDDRSTLLLLSPLPLILLLAYFSLSRPIKTFAPGMEVGGEADGKERSPPDTRLSSGERCAAFWAATPYFGALFLVFLSEYISLNGVVTTIAFPDSGFSQRAHYMIYMYTYAISVWISRTSVSCFRIPWLWPQSILQALTLAVLVCEAMFRFIPSVYIMFGITLWMGLLGGSVFANAFYSMRSDLPERYREFALGLGTGADSLGIALAGLINFFVEPALVSYCKSQYPNIAGPGFCRTRAGG